MLRPIVTLGLPSNIITKLRSKGFKYVEDLINNQERLQNPSRDDDYNVLEIKKLIQFSKTVALDFWETESKKKSISTCCPSLDVIFGIDVHYGVINELSGAPFSGKTQICMQLCISVQLNECHGGLNGRAIYIDTRSGISALRFSGKTIL